MEKEDGKFPQQTPLSKVFGWLMIIFGSMPIMMYAVDRSSLELISGLALCAAGACALAYGRLTGK